MTQESDRDLALETLLEVAKTFAPDLPETLLKKIYAIQYSHQFDRERDVSLQELQRALDNYIDSLVETGA